MRKIAATLALATGLTVAATAPAQALIFGQNAQETPEAMSVVRLELYGDDGSVGNCTGTAVSGQWIVTAQHCIEGFGAPGGKAYVGVTGPKAEYEINHWEAGPHGDIAMVHVTEDMGLDFYPEVANDVPATGEKVRVYGWSSLGQGATGTLPTATLTMADCNVVDFCADGAMHLSHATLPTTLQQGDSGGPMFYNGKLTGALSAAISSGLLPPQLSGAYIHTRTDVNYDWIMATMATSPEGEGKKPAFPVPPTNPGFPDTPFFDVPLPVLPSPGFPSPGFPSPGLPSPAL